MVGNGTIHGVLAERAKVRPEAAAILAPGRAELTYAGLCAQIERTAARLRGLGVGQGDRVAIVLPNGPELAAAFVSVASCAVSAPLNPAYRAEEFEFYLEDLAARAVIVARGADSPVREVARRRGIAVVELIPQRDGPAGAFDLDGEVEGDVLSSAGSPRPDGRGSLPLACGSDSPREGHGPDTYDPGSAAASLAGAARPTSHDPASGSVNNDDVMKTQDGVARRGLPLPHGRGSLTQDSGSAAASLAGTARPTSHGPAAQDRDTQLAGANDVALVLHTSGTTARPKMVPLTHANVCASAGNVAATLALSERDRCLNVMPLFHIHGLIGAVLSSLSAGASVVCTPGFAAERFFEWLKETGATWYSAVPTMHQAILARAQGEPEAAAGCGLRLIRSSSSALPPQVLAGLEAAFGAPVIESYGMTEASHQMTSNPLPPRPRKPGTVGVAAGPQVAVMDEQGRLLPAGESGEVVIRGENVTSGYVSNPEANARAFTDGWFRTGDRGVMDADGYLTIIGRIKEMVNRGGEKIAPREVDEALLAHPDVVEAAAFAVPHRTLGDDLAAAVVAQAGSGLSEQEVRRFAFERLAPHKVPSRVVVLERIPKGPTGKVQRVTLAKALAKELESEYAAPRGELEESLATAWAEVLKVERVGRDDNFFALGGDSLSGVQAVLAAERLVGRELERSIIFQSPTIAQMAAVLEGGVAGQEESYLVPLQPAGEGVPLFCVPGHGGDVYTFAGLSRCLGRDRPVYALRYPEEAARDDGVASEMLAYLADRYVRQVRSVQPDGPYLLVGFCYGGQIVFEMAHRLREQGAAVGLVAIAELYVQGAMRRPLRGLRGHLQQLRQRTAAQKARYLLERAEAGGLRVSDRCFPWLRQRVGRPLPSNGHVLRRYPGRITLFRCSEFDAGLFHDDPRMGWDGLADEIEAYDLPGDRIAALREPGVRVLAERLKASLAAGGW